jgi:hypothetical protein
LGFAFFGHSKMAMFLIPGLLQNLDRGLKGESGENNCCIFSPAVKLSCVLSISYERGGGENWLFERTLGSEQWTVDRGRGSGEKKELRVGS